MRAVVSGTSWGAGSSPCACDGPLSSSTAPRPSRSTSGGSDCAVRCTTTSPEITSPVSTPSSSRTRKCVPRTPRPIDRARIS
ncbi:hypothetical protein C1X31_34320, partial [Pseudomonas sp. GW456-11-11-14-LB2]